MPQPNFTDENKSCVSKMPPYLFSHIADNKTKVEGYFMTSHPLH